MNWIGVGLTVKVMASNEEDIKVNCKARRLLFSTSSLSLSSDGSIDVVFENETEENCGPHSLRLSESMDDNFSGTDSLEKTAPGCVGTGSSFEERRRSSSADTDLTKDWDYQWRNLIFDPDGQAYYYWLAVIAVATTYNCGIIILRLAFGELREGTPYQSLFTVLDYLSDVIYLVDIGVHLRTGYLEDGILVLDPEKLKQNYKQKQDFKLAVLSLIPFGSVATVLSRFLDLFGIVCIGKYHLHSPIVRINRLLKYHMVPRFFEITDSQTSNPNLVRAFKLSLYLWIVIHWIACFYYMLSEFEGLGSNEWVYPNGTQSQRFLRKYTLCVYWSMMTLTTIGERAPPETDIEYIFTGFTFMIGVFVFAAVVGNVGDVISNMNAARQDYLARMDQVKFYMNHRKVPSFLQNRVKRWAHYSWTRTQAIDEASLLEMLPERIRTEIAIHTNLETLKKVQIFEECEEGLLQELVLKLRPQIYSPRDYICRIGEIGREMYIINHGKVEILVHNPASGGKMVVATLTAGNYFGEISLLKLDAGQNRRTADVRSVGYSELLCLSRKDLLSAIVEYPDAKVILEEKARERMQMNKQARRTSSADSVEEDDNGGTSGEMVSREETISNKSRLADVIRSNTFQSMLSKRGKEMTELKHVIEELKAFDSQATKVRIQQLSKKCEDLMCQLKTRDTELQQAIKRIAELEQAILGPAVGRWKKLDRNGLTTVDCKHAGCRQCSGNNGNSQYDNTRLNVSCSEHTAGVGVLSDYQNNVSNGPVNGQSQHGVTRGSNSKVQDLSCDTFCDFNADHIIPEIKVINSVDNCVPQAEQNSSELISQKELDGDKEDIDLETALLAVLSLQESTHLTDLTYSNPGSSVNSDADSDDIDL